MSIIEIDPGGFVVESLPGEAMLAALRRHGIAPRSGCRRGGCSLCKADVVSGVVAHEAGTAVSDGLGPTSQHLDIGHHLPIDDLPIDAKFLATEVWSACGARKDLVAGQISFR
ncbi:2Fe-2S iron-sulfur cluster-binding protein [Mycolicibacterium sp. P9-64]|uniref:2Fe-2S iron-sulfur cluster-binding protein n=1 Tax=Mycolicibacterium sp. P9-64 TaxID=2024612 RepID=UPI0015679EF6|nr:2Fe-2S iron-sulfur cluster-binding protein [Mycolicibacterium sp. P9-64]